MVARAKDTDVARPFGRGDVLQGDHVVAPAALVKKAQVVAAPEEEGF